MSGTSDWDATKHYWDWHYGIRGNSLVEFERMERRAVC